MKIGTRHQARDNSNKLKLISYTVIALLFAFCQSADAQQPKNIPRIGFLRVAAPSENYIDAFRAGLHDAGYVEGQDYTLEFKWAEGKSDRLARLADELVRSRVSIIITEGTIAALPAKHATSTIPIVMASSADPIRSGLIASYAHPGANVTGLAGFTGELGGKILELIKEIVPKLTRVAIIRPVNSPGDDLFIRTTANPAHDLGLQLKILTVHGQSDFENAFRVAAKSSAGAVMVRGTPFSSPADRKYIVELAAKNRLPAIYETREYVETGGLISYGTDRVDMYRRAAMYMDKILKGTKPGDLPVERPMKFELVINLKTAKQIGLTIPPNVLARADRVIR